MSLLQILNEDRSYWFSVCESSKNRLVKRTASRNITKRNIQITKVLRIQQKNDDNKIKQAH